MISFRKFAVAALLAAAAYPAQAGELTGNDKYLSMNGRSECSFSGQNDLDGDPRDPGFRFCGAACQAGQLYCSHHRVRSVNRDYR